MAKICLYFDSMFVNTRLIVFLSILYEFNSKDFSIKEGGMTPKITLISDVEDFIHGLFKFSFAPHYGSQQITNGDMTSYEIITKTGNGFGHTQII